MIRLIACGKVKEKWMRDGIEEYAKRIQPYEKLEIVEVKDPVLKGYEFVWVKCKS